MSDGRWTGVVALAVLLVAGCPGDDDDSGEPPADDDATDDDDSAGDDDDALTGYTTSAEGVFDEHGRHLLLRGINVPTQDSEAADFQRIAGWGNNMVRQLYFWADVEPEEGVIDEAFLAKLDSQVQLAAAEGLLVLIDHHQHGYGVGFGCWGMPAWTCDEQYYEQCVDDPWNYFCDGMETCFELFWTGEELKQKYIDHLVLLAERYADEPAVIGFDLINEPFCMHTTLEECGVVMGDFYSDAAQQILAVAPDKLIFYEPNFIELAGFPTHVTGLEFAGKGVYAAHYYLMEVHDGGDYDGSPAQIEFNVGLRADEAVTFDAPLFLGEYGGMTSAANFTQYIDDTLDILDSRLGGAAYWLYAEGEGFHILDPDGQEKDFMGAYVRPYPVRTPGVARSMSFDLETRVMSVTFDGTASIAAPGVIFVPDRHYPDGFELRGCDAPACSWEHDSAAQQVRYTLDGDGEYSLQLAPP